VAVVGVPSDVGGEHIWAFIVPEEGTKLDFRSVLDHCRAALEIYKIPDRVKVMADLPCSTLGKVQRFRLREMALQESRGQG
jgi:fatty-acyl-CoA synthase